MKFQFRAIGKDHDQLFREGITDFTSRIKHYFPVEWKIVAQSKSRSIPDICKEDTERLFKEKTVGNVIIALDERGKAISSVQVAEIIEKEALNSTQLLVFAIGGAYGFQQDMIGRSDYVVSLSRLTFPHQLVRLILAEQVYRACTIMRNENYHHK